MVVLFNAFSFNLTLYFLQEKYHVFRDLSQICPSSTCIAAFCFVLFGRTENGNRKQNNVDDNISPPPKNTQIKATRTRTTKSLLCLGKIFYLDVWYKLIGHNKAYYGNNYVRY